MPCCPFFSRCLAALLMAVPLVIVAVNCSPPSNGTPSTKAAGTPAAPTTKGEPGADPRDR